MAMAGTPSFLYDNNPNNLADTRVLDAKRVEWATERYAHNDIMKRGGLTRTPSPNFFGSPRVGGNRRTIGFNGQVGAYRHHGDSELGHALGGINTLAQIGGAAAGVAAGYNLQKGINQLNGQIAYQNAYNEQNYDKNGNLKTTGYEYHSRHGRPGEQPPPGTLLPWGMSPTPTKPPTTPKPPTPPVIQTTPATGVTPSIVPSGLAPTTTNLTTAGSPPSVTRPPTSRSVSRPSPTATPGTFVRPTSPTTSSPTSRTFNRRGVTSQVPVTGTRPPTESESAQTRSNPLINWRTSRQARKMARDPNYKNPILFNNQTPIDILHDQNAWNYHAWGPGQGFFP